MQPYPSEVVHVDPNDVIWQHLHFGAHPGVDERTAKRICAVVTDTANQLARRRRRKRLLLALMIELDPNVIVQLFVAFARTLFSLRVCGNSGIQLRAFCGCCRCKDSGRCKNCSCVQRPSWESVL